MVEFHLGELMNPEIKELDDTIVACRKQMIVLETLNAFDVIFMCILIGMDHRARGHIKKP